MITRVIHKISHVISEKPVKSLQQEKDKSPGKVAATVVPTAILVIGGAVVGFLVFYFRLRICPVNKDRMKEEVEPPTGHFDNPLYGQAQKAFETNA